jgi:hypothetical protein
MISNPEPRKGQNGVIMKPAVEKLSVADMIALVVYAA